jgi:hypothetical protein
MKRRGGESGVDNGWVGGGVTQRGVGFVQRCFAGGLVLGSSLIYRLVTRLGDVCETGQMLHVPVRGSREKGEGAQSKVHTHDKPTVCAWLCI